MKTVMHMKPRPTTPIYLPSEDMPDPPCREGEPMETHRHVLQMILLIQTLSLFWNDREDVFISGTMFVYFSPEHVFNKDFLGPDFFAVLGVPKRDRKSWVVWQEGKGPELVIELISESTAAKDKHDKKLIYQDKLFVPEYIWFDIFNGQWEGFVLQNGIYHPMPTMPTDQGERLVSTHLGLALVRWRGTFNGIYGRWLRWETLEGMLIPTPEELAAQERQEKELALLQIKQFKEKLRKLGIDPEK